MALSITLLASFSIGSGIFTPQLDPANCLGKVSLYRVSLASVGLSMAAGSTHMDQVAGSGH